MRSYEALLVDRTALIDKYRRDHTLLRNQNKSREEENHELRKTLAEFESSVAVNNHKIESLIINKDLLAEQNEVLIHKVNLFNTTLNLLLSKYETLEIKNLQLSRKNNSLIRAAKLAEMRTKFHQPQNWDQSKYAPNTDPFHQPKGDDLSRSKYTTTLDKSQHPTEMNEKLDPYDQNGKTKSRKDSDGFFGLFPPELSVKDEMEIYKKVNKSEKALANKNSDIEQTGRAFVSVDEIPDHLVKDEMERHKKTNKSKNEFVNENLDDEILQKKTNKSNNEFANENIENKNIVNENEIQLRKTINQLGREIVALRERNALLASRNLDGHAQCISKSVHENIVRYFERTFDELTEKYREQVKREREGKPKQLEEKSSQQIMEMEQIHHQLTLEEKLPQQKLELKRQPQQKVKILEENQQQAYLQQQQQQHDKLEENLQRVKNQPKYETLEIKNLQLSRKNNSLIRAAKLAEMRSKFHHPQAANLDRTKVDSDQSIAPNFDQSKYALSKDRFHQPKLDQSLDANFNQPKAANLGRSEYTPISDKSQHTTKMNLDPYDQNDKTKGRKDSDEFFGLFPPELLVKDEMEIYKKVNKREKALANKNSDIDLNGIEILTSYISKTNTKYQKL
ncbi:SUN domain-containing protein 2-like [Diaphorina citri]|uniref:SUN domain-containing protein 2-like n=1 Tax=Diaphorina citri TaxID=121845 RepID=A0A3Q0JIA9_DIACI|nr:SUN domain-containing protein 2-like [Diaphorina citri]